MIVEVRKAMKNHAYLFVTYANGKRELLTGKTIASYEAPDYIRLNRQRLVHKSIIVSVRRGCAKLKDGNVERISRRRVKDVTKCFLKK